MKENEQNTSCTLKKLYKNTDLLKIAFLSAGLRNTTSGVCPVSPQSFLKTWAHHHTHGRSRSLGTEQGLDQRCKQYLGQLPIANYHARAVFCTVPSHLLIKGGFKYDECWYSKFVHNAAECTARGQESPPNIIPVAINCASFLPMAKLHERTQQRESLGAI